MRSRNNGNMDILNQMLYAITGYTNSIHSTTKPKPIDVTNGHLYTKDIFEINANEELMDNYIKEPKNTKKHLKMFKSLKKYS